MIKAIFMDLDGTLLRENGKISKHTKTVLKRLNSKGIEYFIATGRPLQLLKGIVHDLDYDKEMITMNGSVIIQSKSHAIVYKKTIDQTILQTILSKALNEKYLIMLYGEHAIYSDDNERVHYFKKQFNTRPKSEHPNFLPLEDYNGEEISKVLIVEHDQNKYNRFKLFASKFNVSIVSSQSGFLDINPINVSKGKAIDAITKKYHFNKNEIIAFGDQENDVTMKQYVDTFIAMANATDHVKEVADEVTLTNKEDGVARWIESHILY